MKKTVAMLLGLLVCPTLQAASPSYDFVTAGLVATDFDENDDFTPAGVAVRGYKRLSRDFYLAAEFSRQSDTLAGVDLDVDELTLGLGYRARINASTDWVSVVAYEQFEISGEQGGIQATEDEGSIGVSSGFRGMMTESLELRGMLKYQDNNGGNLLVTLSADYFFTPDMAVGVELGRGENRTLGGVFVRYNF